MRTCVQLALVALTAFSVSAQAVPEIQQWYTDNGAKVLFVPAHELPMVDLQLTFDAGSARDGDQAGLARLTNSLLAEGAGGLSADALADRFADVGAELRNNSLRDMSILSLRSLSDPAALDPALEALAMVVAKPDFPPAALARERQRMLVAIQTEAQSPGDVAEKAFYKAVYGDHPYASPPSGTPEALQAIDRADVKAFHARYFVGANAVVAIVGDLTRERAEQVAAQVVGALPKGEPAPALPAVAPRREPRTVRVAHPSVQSHVYMGMPGMRRSDPDYFPLYVGNHVLGGGGLVSLLAEQVRQDRGLSYNVGSRFSPMAVEGPFAMELQTRNDQVDEAVEVLNDTLAGFVAQGPAAEDLDRGINNLTGSFPLRIATNRSVASHLAMMGFYDLPLDFLSTYTEHVEAQTAEAIRGAFKARIDPDALVTVIVGGPAETAPQQAATAPSGP
jgi:zinc protease